MKVKKLLIDYPYDFELYGVSTSLKDYKIAWLINQQIHVQLVRKEDYFIELTNEKIKIINYSYQIGHNELRLFKNKAVVENENTQKYMVSEMKYFDYFVMVTGIIHTFTSGELLQQIWSVKGVQFAIQIDIDTLKSRNYFLY